eukprot:CAMPEP_0203918464 /NCGR_PEP_ID=MMETSP0359-20131031/58989_1 /ASSEMBLY_ACC=CAM_ASM_000338 /TAXON_ID=268821 /ORGANISM="Scrippsiella Hangoei, Strain SHTV-5" /LENGTH=38 /DNA_ID= /DNA_START= /DNA_END= /DNA_ORIENTATION=
MSSGSERRCAATDGAETLGGAGVCSYPSRHEGRGQEGG